MRLNKMNIETFERILHIVSKHHGQDCKSIDKKIFNIIIYKQNSNVYKKGF